MSYDAIKYCPWTKYANQTINWYGYDAEEWYQYNLKKNFNKLKTHGWENNVSIEYKFNSHGFRCEEFTDTNSVMFLGCSCTLGVGLPKIAIFPNLVANSLKLNCINLSHGGASADTGFRLAQIYLKKLQPKIVIATFLFPNRTELLTEYGALQLVPNHIDAKESIKKYFEQYYRLWIGKSENSELNHLKNILAIKQMCYDLNIKFVSFTDIYSSWNQIFVNTEHSLARDLKHPGIEIHKDISKILLDHI